MPARCHVVAHGHRLAGAGGADDGDDVLLLDEPAGRSDRLGLVGRVVFDDHLDGPAVDAARVVDLLDLHLDEVLLGLAEAGVGAREREDGADLDRLRGARAVARRLAVAAAARGEERERREQHCGEHRQWPSGRPSTHHATPTRSYVRQAAGMRSVLLQTVVARGPSVGGAPPSASERLGRRHVARAPRARRNETAGARAAPSRWRHPPRRGSRMIARHEKGKPVRARIGPSGGWPPAALPAAVTTSLGGSARRDRSGCGDLGRDASGEGLEVGGELLRQLRGAQRRSRPSPPSCTLGPAGRPRRRGTRTARARRTPGAASSARRPGPPRGRP